MQGVDVYNRFLSVKRRFFILAAILTLVTASLSVPTWRAAIWSDIGGVNEFSLQLSRTKEFLEHPKYKNDTKLQGLLERLMRLDAEIKVASSFDSDAAAKTNPKVLARDSIVEILWRDYPEYMSVREEQTVLYSLIYLGVLILAGCTLVSSAQLTVLWLITRRFIAGHTDLSRKDRRLIKGIELLPFKAMIFGSGLAAMLAAVIIFEDGSFETLLPHLLIVVILILAYFSLLRLITTHGIKQK